MSTTYSLPTYSKTSWITCEKHVCDICDKEKICLTFDNTSGLEIGGGGPNDPCAVCKECAIDYFLKYSPETKK